VSDRIDRRNFLGRGLSAAGLVTVGGGLPALLSACGSSSSSPSASSGTAGVSTATPKPGGKVVFATSSEVNGMDPSSGRFDGTGYLYANAVFDSLTQLDATGKPQPYLAASVAPNPTYTVWTIKLRPGVMFHDGKVCDAAAVKFNIDNLRHSALVGPALSPISDVSTPDSMTVVVTMNTPWVPFDYYLAGQPGFIAAPSMLQDTANGPLHPVGTGPFVFKEWVPGDHFLLTRNQHYWRPGLPYLDELEYRPIIDETAQENSINSGVVDMLSTGYPQDIVDLQKNSQVVVIDDAKSLIGEPQLNFYMLNTAVAPLDDIRIRQALAYATDLKALQEALSAGLLSPETTLFPPGSPYYAPAPYPSFDPAKARSLVQSYEREKGPVSFELGGPQTSVVLTANQLVQQQWKSVGIQTHIVQVQEQTYILNALLGKYQVYFWQQFGTPDPDANYVFWATNNAAPVGQYALQFPRLKDQRVQQAIDAGRVTADPTARARAYQQVGQIFNQDLPYIWLSRAINAVAAKTYVQNFANPTLPSGQKGLGLSNGVVQVAQIWRSS
jgi:peptide/nickel transport system substrate-binding protein